MSTRKRAAAPPVRLSVRLDAAVLARVDALTTRFSVPWRKATRSDIVRILIDRGLSVVEKPSKARGGR